MKTYSQIYKLFGQYILQGGLLSKFNTLILLLILFHVGSSFSLLLALKSIDVVQTI